MLDLNQDIAQLVCMSKFTSLPKTCNRVHELPRPFYDPYTNDRYTADENGHKKLQINAQNCLHCKVQTLVTSYVHASIDTKCTHSESHRNNKPPKLPGLHDCLHIAKSFDVIVVSYPFSRFSLQTWFLCNSSRPVILKTQNRI